MQVVRFLQGLKRSRDAEAAGGWTRIEIPTSQGPILGILHPVEGARGAVVMVGGSRGGTRGPAGVYAPLANRLRAAGIAALRLEYRQPNRLAACVADVVEAVADLERQGVGRVVLVGWSFGGAVVITAGANSDLVVGVATVASQTRGTESVGRLAPKALLLLHGTADRTLSDHCSRTLYARAHPPKELLLYPRDDHGITRHADRMLDKLYGWSRGLLLGTRSDAEGSRSG